MHAITDSSIRFPGLFGDWVFTASSKALDIGHGVYWYGILIALGAALAVLICMRLKDRYGITEDDLLDAVLWGLPLGIIGARIYYVVFYLDLYRNSDGSLNWGEMVAIWDGGLAIYGGVITAVIVVWAVGKVKKVPFFALMDVIVIGLLIGQAVGRWGNFMNREAFGAETTLPWRMELVLTTGETVCVHPTFLYESLWNVVGLLLILLVLAPRRRFDGQNTWFYFLWYGLGRFWIEGLRTDSLYLFGLRFLGQPVRVSQALSLVMILLGGFMLLYHLKLHPHDPGALYVNKKAAAAAKEGEA